MDKNNESAGSSNTRILLVGDIGGTNASFAHVQVTKGTFTILERVVLPSAEQHDFVSALSSAIEDLEASAGERQNIHACCISAAGPVKDGRCIMTNLPYPVDSQEIQARVQVPSLVINDFEAICYGIPLLDLNDPQQALPIRIPEAAAESRPGVAAVLGAGTGLGMGYLHGEGAGLSVHASEGGHLDFAPWDERTSRLNVHLNNELGRYPDREHALSGRALPRLYRFVRGESMPAGTPGQAVEKTGQILDLPVDEQPAAIAVGAAHDPVCAETMRLFFRIYGRQCAAAALQFLPEYGVFLAGGVSAKNAEAIAGSDDFAEAYLDGYNGAMREHLLATPLYIIRDYRISLRGAAHAALRRL